ncbi:hypothetical protein BEL04_12615 [Mucilaginibacter sp. PPCGB 2223]|uniref:bestrophin-like domain n=1 Tax=Mucilaginibacter sp. PPCGB 2223 TaxID=1886027 RepID=UPI000824FB03|nr:DUF4239 domain-containing protein [Mucilaginibacter sp. PPCGB 2223]OCX52312.1 hypothetical protein BEL04_12615 [Mucilaginibacter sp. PPCGB 2223]
MYYILQLPPFLLLFIIFVLFGSIGVAGVYIFRKYIRIRYKRAHNEAVGFTFAILGGFYGLLLGFVVFFVWDSMKEGHNNADREGSLAKGLYRNIRYYADNDPAQRELMKSYLKYVNYVLYKEYPDMEHLRSQGDSGRLYFNDVFYKMEKLKGNDVRMAEMFEQLNELATYRSLRQLDGDSAMSIEIWVPILIGAFILLVSALMIDMESVRLHMTITAMLGIFIGMVMYIIILLDHPFTGKIRIEPTGYRDVITMTHDVDRSN